MLPLIGAAIGAAGAFGGGILDYFGQKEANEANAKQAELNRQFQHSEAQEQMAYQTRMSNSAYQRARADMEAAGFNPMLAYTQGGASSPAGQAGSGAQATMQSTTEGLGKGVESAAQAARVAAELKTAKAQSELMESQTQAAESSRDLNWANATKASNEASLANIRYLQEQYGLKAFKKEQDVRYKQSLWDEKAIDLDNVTKRINNILQPVGSAVGLARQFKGKGGPPPMPTDGSGRTRAEVERDNYKRRLDAQRKN